MSLQTPSARAVLVLTLTAWSWSFAAPALAQNTPAQDTQRVEAPEPATNFDETMKELTSIRQKVDVASSQLELINTENQINQAKRTLGGAQAGTLDIPELLGLTGTPSKLVAEFNVGYATLEATEGQWVTPEWKLSRFFSNGVELVRKGGRETHTLLLGAGGQRGHAPAGVGAPFSSLPAGTPGAPPYN